MLTPAQLIIQNAFLFMVAQEFSKLDISTFVVNAVLDPEEASQWLMDIATGSQRLSFGCDNGRLYPVLR